MAMQIHYTLTLDDYREAVRVNGYSATLAGGVVALSVGVVMLLLCAGERITGLIFPDDGLAGQSLSIVLLPVCLILVGSIAAGAMRRQMMARTRPPAAWIRWSIPLAAAAAWVGALVVSLLPVERESPFIDEPVPNFTFAWIVAVLALYVLLKGVLRGAVRQMWEGSKDQHRPKQMEVSEQGVVVRDGISCFEWNWPAFEGWKEGKKVYILQISRFSILIMPKQAFASEAQRQEFEGLLQQGITGPAKGFAVVQRTDEIPVAKLASASPPPLPATESPRA